MQRLLVQDYNKSYQILFSILNANFLELFYLKKKKDK